LNNSESQSKSTVNKTINKSKQHAHKQKSSSFTTSVDPAGSHSYQQRSATRSCYFCKAPHDLDDCDEFAKLKMDDKRTFIKEKKMCFACYGFKHTSKGCLRKRTCKTCGKRHPSALHIDNFRLPTSNDGRSSRNSCNRTNSDDVRDETNICNSASTVSVETVLQAILPVNVRQRGSSKIVTTYALYDNGSTGCFMTEDLKSQLNANATETNQKLQTMHGVNYVKTFVVSDLVVSDINDVNPVELPKTYTRNEIPVNHKQIPKPEFF